jgi:hypothetical protein
MLKNAQELQEATENTELTWTFHARPSFTDSSADLAEYSHVITVVLEIVGLSINTAKIFTVWFDITADRYGVEWDTEDLIQPHFRHK